jgi:DNA-binding MarR family transcriptional regulator
MPCNLLAVDDVAPTTGSLVWHLAMRWRTEVDRAVAPFGLTHAQYSVLASLHAVTARGERPTQRELAGYADLKPIYVSKLVRALEGRGHLTRDADGDDARAVRLDLTDEGRATIEAARRVVGALDRVLTEPIGGPEGPRTVELADTLSVLLDQRSSTRGTP